MRNMTQTQRRLYLIRKLLAEQDWDIKIPEDEHGQKQLLRSLFNIRMPKPAHKEFLMVQDAYLQQETAQKGVTDISELTSIHGIYLWRGDITTLRCNAIVNAANAQMLGCFCPCHGCIDNQIHTYSGIQLRLACAELAEKQGRNAQTGEAWLTPAFNLPCNYVLHTVGPIITGNVTRQDENLLAECYRACLNLAIQNKIESIAFCCISTGEFRFPNQRAAEIAIQTVKEYANDNIKIIFNVFKDIDYEIYRKLLG